MNLRIGAAGSLLHCQICGPGETRPASRLDRVTGRAVPVRVCARCERAVAFLPLQRAS